MRGPLAAVAFVALGALVACDGSASEVIPDSGACLADPVAPGGTCPSVCDSCTDSTCHIACASAECNDTTITCPADFDCDITCDGLDSCDTTRIECPSQYACTVACTAYDACGDVTLVCGAGPCGMTCNGPTESCGGSKIDCATGGKCSSACNGSTGPSVDCAGACECTPC